jgi:hypothetical protein
MVFSGWRIVRAVRKQVREDIDLLEKSKQRSFRCTSPGDSPEVVAFARNNSTVIGLEIAE